jgi:hypothetical protein
VQRFFRTIVGFEAERSTLLRCGESFGLRAPAITEIGAVHDFAAGLIGGEIASSRVLAAVCRRAPGSLLICSDSAGVEGLLATLPLRETGRRSLLSGSFDGVRLDIGQVARAGEGPAAAYAWGCAARTRTAAKALLGASQAMAEEVFADIPFYSRAATDAGRRTLTASLGYVPLKGSDPDLYWRPAGVRLAA